MFLSLTESQAVNAIARVLYEFLPGKPHPYADPNISFEGVAKKLGMAQFWTGGSKLPAITTLLEQTLEHRREQFSDLVLEIVRRGLVYRNQKGNPITRQEIQELNQLIVKVRFKIPELWDANFLNSLANAQPQTQHGGNTGITDYAIFKTELLALTQLKPQARGFAFEKYLQDIFSGFGLAPRSAFRLVGEQIDGSFQLNNNTYLVEAKWHDTPTPQADLLIFQGKVEGKARWTRGVFISYNGFTQDGLTAFSRGRATNIIGVNSQDIYFMMEKEVSLAEVLTRKLRWAAETGDFYVSVFDLFQ